MSSILKKYVDEFRDGRDLSGSDAEPFLDSLIEESDELILADIFRTWNDKGIAEDEIYFLAKIMRERCTKVASKHNSFVDIVGTGGSKAKIFNVSTAAAFVVAGGGVPVAKHGNKAATSNSGSADVLSALGIEPAVNAATAERCLNEIGICFMFAPKFHHLSSTLAKVRRGLGFPTIFNCVGPLCNPAGAPHQLIGVWGKELVPKMAGALARLGTKRSWVVHGDDGLDEISLSGPTFIAEIENDAVRAFEIRPRDFGLEQKSLNGFHASSPSESARIVRDVLDQKHEKNAPQDVVLINAAAAIYLAGHSKDMLEAFDAANTSLRGGRALNKLKELATAVRS